MISKLKKIFSGPHYHKSAYEWRMSLVTGGHGLYAKRCKECGFYEKTPFGAQWDYFKSITGDDGYWVWDNGRFILKTKSPVKGKSVNELYFWNGRSVNELYSWNRL